MLQGTLHTAMEHEWYLNDTNWFEVVKPLYSYPPRPSLPSPTRPATSSRRHLMSFASACSPTLSSLRFFPTLLLDLRRAPTSHAPPACVLTHVRCLHASGRDPCQATGFSQCRSIVPSNQDSVCTTSCAQRNSSRLPMVLPQGLGARGYG